VQHQDKPKIVRLRNKFVPIDPRGWDDGMDMTVNIALGRGSDEQRMMFLTQIIQQQKEIIQVYGPFNPLVDLNQLRDALAEVTQLAGFQDPTKFWKEINPQEVQAYMQQMAGNKKQDPAEMLAQVEAEKIKADILINAAKQELERNKAMAQADIERDKLFVDAMIRATELQAKYGTQVDIAMIKGEVDRQREEIRAMFSAAQAQQVAPKPQPQPMPLMGMPMGM
jgi:hypothetical protein